MRNRQLAAGSFLAGLKARDRNAQLFVSFATFSGPPDGGLRSLGELLQLGGER